MGYLKYVNKLWQDPHRNMPALMKERLIKWRREPVTLRLDRPTRLDRARSLGYKAKQGYIIVRQRVLRAKRMRPTFHGGRRPKHMRRTKVLNMNYQYVAEQRAQKKYVNCEILNSYEVAEDGKYYWFEIILVDKSHPSILADRRISWIADRQHTGRVFRGLTSAAKKARGLRHKGRGAEKLRSSVKKNEKKQNKQIK